MSTIVSNNAKIPNNPVATVFQHYPKLFKVAYTKIISFPLY